MVGQGQDIRITTVEQIGQKHRQVQSHHRSYLIRSIRIQQKAFKAQPSSQQNQDLSTRVIVSAWLANPHRELEQCISKLRMMIIDPIISQLHKIYHLGSTGPLKGRNLSRRVLRTGLANYVFFNTRLHINPQCLLLHWSAGLALAFHSEYIPLAVQVEGLVQTNSNIKTRPRCAMFWADIRRIQRPPAFRQKWPCLTNECNSTASV